MKHELALHRALRHLLALRTINEHRQATVNRRRECDGPARVKYGFGAGVGIDAGAVPHSQRKVPLRGVEFVHAMQEGGAVRGRVSCWDWLGTP